MSAVETNATRQKSMVNVVSLLEKQATDIGEITRVVGDISDQTNLLALNAAIEAARAGDNGRGFAVVADEVRALAGTSEKSAQVIQTLAEGIVGEVRSVAERIKASAETASGEAQIGRAVVGALDKIRTDVSLLAEGSQAILVAAVEADTAIREAQRGAEQVASAAEEQAAAAAEAQRAVQQQSASLDQSQQTAQSLAALADDLQAGTAASHQCRAGRVGSRGTVGGDSGTLRGCRRDHDRRRSDQPGRANSGCGHPAGQCGHGADRAGDCCITRCGQHGRRAHRDSRRRTLQDNRTATMRLAAGVGEALKETLAVIGLMSGLDESGRRIEKIVDGIALVAVQTNMLAVSGSVEAARAGEAGRGFAHRLSRYPQPGAGFFGECRTHQGCRAPSATRSPPCGGIWSRSLAIAKAEVAKNPLTRREARRRGGRYAGDPAGSTAILRDARRS